MIVVPFALVLIAGVLYAATTSLIDVFIIMAQIPGRLPGRDPGPVS